MPAYIWDFHVASLNNWSRRLSRVRTHSMKAQADIPPHCGIKLLHRAAHLPRRCIIWKRPAFVPRSHAPYGPRINDHWNWVKKSLGILTRMMKKINEATRILAMCQEIVIWMQL